MQVITTRGVPPGDRFEFWRDIVARGALQFRMELLQPVGHAPHAKMWRAAIGGLTLMKFESAFITRYSRTRAEIARSQPPYHFLQLQLDGRCQLQRAEEQFSLAVGDGSVADPLRE